MLIKIEDFYINPEAVNSLTISQTEYKNEFAPKSKDEWEIFIQTDDGAGQRLLIEDRSDFDNLAKLINEAAEKMWTSQTGVETGKHYYVYQDVYDGVCACGEVLSFGVSFGNTYGAASVLGHHIRLIKEQ